MSIRCIASSRLDMSTAKATEAHCRPSSASIILLTFNRWDRTEQLLASILADNDSYDDVELVWIDNASSDHTRIEFCRWLERHEDRFGRVTRRSNESNHGFVVGVNEGISMASGQYVCLINSDAVVPDHWLSSLRQLASDNCLAATGPVSDGMPWNQSMEFFGQGLRRPPVIYGFCLVTRRDVIDRVGLLDERFGRGVIEVEDWCERASQLGLGFAIDTSVMVRHDEPHASYTPRVNAMLHIRNRRLFESKWGVGPWIWGDRTSSRRRFARSSVQLLGGSAVDVKALDATLASLDESEELIIVAEHGDSEHLNWLQMARRDSRLKVVCVRPGWDRQHLADLCRANARSAKWVER